LIVAIGTDDRRIILVIFGVIGRVLQRGHVSLQRFVICQHVLISQAAVSEIRREDGNVAGLGLLQRLAEFFRLEEIIRQILRRF